MQNEKTQHRIHKTVIRKYRHELEEQSLHLRHGRKIKVVVIRTRIVHHSFGSDALLMSALIVTETGPRNFCTIWVLVLPFLARLHWPLWPFCYAMPDQPPDLIFTTQRASVEVDVACCFMGMAALSLHVFDVRHNECYCLSGRKHCQPHNVISKSPNRQKTTRRNLLTCSSMHFWL